ncbi:MAG: single-stranded-DNA-specific exonuclease RecJ [bacterium]
MSDQYGSVIWEFPDKQAILVEDLVSTVLDRRGFNVDEIDSLLKPRYADLPDPFLLPDMKDAVDHILKLRKADHEIAIYGDYDIDGLTACTLLADVFSHLHIKHRIYIPDRFEEGYGINIQAVDELHKEGVHTVISVDCGSTALAPALRAQELGLHLIITDHHTLIHEKIPGALAHINPLRAASSYPERKLAGVGVAFALARALQSTIPDDFEAGQEKWLLDLVVLGTVCDVVPLVGENRLLAHYGLRVMAKTKRVGIRSLASVSGVDLKQIAAEHLGFRFGPRLNAAGRIEHAQKALRLLTADDTNQANLYAEHLDQLNQARQATTRQIVSEARNVAVNYLDDPILVIGDGNWSHGIVGLVAARLSEELLRPTLVMQFEGDTAKGSARSFGSISIIDAIRSQEDLFESFGGHQAAAGFRIKRSNINALRDGLNAYAKTAIDPESWVKRQSVDAWLEPSFATESGIEQLTLIEPTGQMMPPVRFGVIGQVMSLRKVGQDQSHYQLTVRSDNHDYRMIAFGASQVWPWLEVGIEAKFVIRLSQSEWQGVTKVESIVVDCIPQDGQFE